MAGPNDPVILSGLYTSLNLSAMQRVSATVGQGRLFTIRPIRVYVREEADGGHDGLIAAAVVAVYTFRQVVQVRVKINVHLRRGPGYGISPNRRRVAGLRAAG